MNVEVTLAGITIEGWTDARLFEYRSPDFKEPTWGDWFKHAEDDARTIGMHTDEHPEGTLAWGCRLWLGDRVVIAADPRTVVYYIQGIKLALGMMMRGEITVEPRDAEATV